MQPRDGRVVSNFVVRALAGLPLEVYGDGAQTRLSCYVSDTGERLMRLMDAPADFGGPVNLTNPDEHGVADLARMIVPFYAVVVADRVKPAAADDPRQRRLAAASLGWRPRADIATGLAATIRDFRGVVGNRPATFASVGGVRQTARSTSRRGNRMPSASPPTSSIHRDC